MKSGLFVQGVVIALLLSACCGWAPRPRPVAPDESNRIRTSLVEWFECEECEEGQLEAVVRHGELAVPSLVATLRGGPSAASREMLRQGLEERYAQIVAYGREHPAVKPGSGKDEFVAMYLEKFDAQYRVRAAQALGAIGGVKAREALSSFLPGAKRDDVRESVVRALRAAEERRR